MCCDITCQHEIVARLCRGTESSRDRTLVWHYRDRRWSGSCGVHEPLHVGAGIACVQGALDDYKRVRCWLPRVDANSSVRLVRFDLRCCGSPGRQPCNCAAGGFEVVGPAVPGELRPRILVEAGVGRIVQRIAVEARLFDLRRPVGPSAAADVPTGTLVAALGGRGRSDGEHQDGADDRYGERSRSLACPPQGACRCRVDPVRSD